MKMYFKNFLPWLSLLLILACTDPPSEGENEMMGGDDDTPDMRELINPFADMRESSSSDMGQVDSGPVEESPCMSDDGCFAGRICQDSMCVEAECQSDADCPVDRPVCIGPEGEEPAQRKGRCGDCRSDDDCYGDVSCVFFGAMDTDDELQMGGLCTLEGACQGTLECAPSSRLTVSGSAQEVCLDRTASAEDPACVPAFNCQAEDECPAGLTCLESGSCASIDLNMVCDTSAQCGFGEICRQDGLCGACQSDADCGNAQSCTQGQCVEIPGACQADEDCLGDRICSVGECRTAACDEDAFGEHASFDQALEIQGDRNYHKLVSCVDDWYQFTLPPMTGALIAVRQLDRGANLGLVVVDAQQVELGRSVGAAPLEAVRVVDSPQARLIYVRVFQEGPQSVAEYNLEIMYNERNNEVCLDDPFELNAGDDTRSRARLFRLDSNDTFPKEINGQICPDDQDVLCFYLGANENLSIRGTVELGDALLLGSLTNPDGREVASGNWASDENANDIEWVVETSGRHCLVLTSDTSDDRRLGQGRYSFEIKTVSPQLASLCEDSEEITIENNRGAVNATLPEGNSALAASCAPESNSAELSYYIDVTAPSLLVTRLIGLSTGTLGDPVVSLRTQCDQNNSEVACSARSYDLNNPFVIPPNPAILRTPLNPEVDPVTGRVASRYTLVVDGVNAGESADFQLNVELRPLAPPPVNDSCNRVTELSFENGLSVVEGYLDQAQNDDVGCGEGGPDIMYSFTVEETSSVNIQVTSKPAEFPVLIALSENCGRSDLTCGFIYDQVLTPGEYFIAAVGVDQQSRGLIELQVALNPLPEIASNETCESAIALDGESGTITASTQGAQDDYTLEANNLCTRYPTNAPDIVYSIEAQANVPLTITATPELGWDLSLYLLNDCNEADPVQGCLAGQDGALSETITYTPASTGMLYIVVDGSNGEAGTFDLTWESGTP